MAYTVLARRYRSATFDEVIGQNHVAQTLKKAIQSGRIAHAYLFNGTRGVGKTSMARILAKALNCEKSAGATAEPCLKCASCEAIARGEDIDVIEIDAASNTGVDNIREIIENSQYRPARSRFKVYIIDEVHMLSKSAFNALLKTLEEPPSHVKFILATTEPEKVLPTILSRCQRYDFRNIPTREIAAHLKSICASEKLQAHEDALLMVARAGAGSMRDSLSLLDRLLSLGEKELTVETLERLLGLPKSQLVFNLAGAIGEARVKDVLEQADRMITEGLSADSLLASLTDHLRNLLIVRTCGLESQLVEVPGLAPSDLKKQAEQFDPMILVQDITILEELRRQLRQTQAGRALLDATLVRLALAGQFTAIADLLDAVRGGDGAQKKKPELTQPAPSQSASAVAPLHSPSTTPAAVATAATELKPEALPAAIATAAPAESTIEFTPSPDEDDDLPRPGKVWDGPSLKELLKPKAPPPPAPAASAPAPAQPGLADVWNQLLQRMGAMMAGGLQLARLDRIDGDTAVIRFRHEGETFARMWERNGKRETIRTALAEVLKRPTSVIFEIDDPSTAPPQSAPSDAQAAPAAARFKPSFAAAPPAAPPPAPAADRLTPEQVQAISQDPLIRSILQEFDARILKLTQD